MNNPVDTAAIKEAIAKMTPVLASDAWHHISSHHEAHMRSVRLVWSGQDLSPLSTLRSGCGETLASEEPRESPCSETPLRRCVQARSTRGIQRAQATLQQSRTQCGDVGTPHAMAIVWRCDTRTANRSLRARPRVCVLRGRRCASLLSARSARIRSCDSSGAWWQAHREEHRCRLPLVQCQKVRQ